MKTVHYPIKKYMARFERYEPLLQDHTAMDIYDTCDHKYFMRIVLGRVPPHSNTQNLLDAGSHYHKFREILERTWYDPVTQTGNKDIEEAQYAAFKYLLSNKVTVTPAAPNSKYAYMDKASLILCCKEAFAYWVKEKEQDKIRVVSIEQPFNIQLTDGSFTAGRADQIIDWDNYWGRDFKFTGKNPENFKRTIDPDDQTTRYIFSESELLQTRLEGIVFEALHHSFTQKEGLKIHIEKHLSSRTDSQLKRWLDDKIFLNEQLAHNREKDHWPMRTNNCNYCDFIRVCKKSNEQAMMTELETYFKLQPWDHEKVEQEEF